MSKKLSQSEIDALVTSLSDEASSEEASAEESPVQAEAAMAQGQTPALDAPVEAALLPAVAPPAPVVGLRPQNMPFELIEDLGPVTQPEVDAAVEAYHNQRTGVSPSPAQTNAPAPEPAVPAVPAAPAAAAVMAPSTPAPGMTLPPSNAHYAASKAQAAQQARRAFSMAALSGVLMDIELTVTVELGSARLSLGEVLALGPGSVITLDKQANTPVTVLVNRLPLMRAEVLAIAERYGVRITESHLNVEAAS